MGFCYFLTCLVICIDEKNSDIKVTRGNDVRGSRLRAISYQACPLAQYMQFYPIVIVILVDVFFDFLQKSSRHDNTRQRSSRSGSEVECISRPKQIHGSYL